MIREFLLDPAKKPCLIGLGVIYLIYIILIIMVTINEYRSRSK